jgi:ribosomal protein L37AE/L43A
MGDVVNAICQCGFEENDCFIGVGMDYPTSLWNPEPAICFHCFRLQIANYNSKRPRCSKCKKRLTFYRDDLSLSIQMNNVPLETESYASKYLCPKCGEKHLEFVYHGIWD